MHFFSSGDSRQVRGRTLTCRPHLKTPQSIVQPFGCIRILISFGEKHPPSCCLLFNKFKFSREQHLMDSLCDGLSRKATWEFDRKQSTSYFSPDAPGLFSLLPRVTVTLYAH